MPSFILLILLYSIFNDIIAENFIVATYNSSSVLTYMLAFGFTTAFAIVQFIAAPIQAGLSDIFGRKKSLIVAIFLSMISLCLLFFYFGKAGSPIAILIAVGAVKGFVGNITPIALGGIYDNQKGAFRTSFAWATSAWALAYAVLAFFSYYIGNENLRTFIYAIFLALNIFILYSIYKEKKEFAPDILQLSHGRAKKIEKNLFMDIFEEIRFSLKDATNRFVLKTLTPYFLWELSLYLLVVYLSDYSQTSSSKIIILTLMLGYLTGISILLICKSVKDKTIIKWGYWISFLSLIPYFLFYSFINHSILLTCCYFAHTVGNALLCPTLLTLLAKERPKHKQGRSYGLADSTDTASYLSANIIILFFEGLHISELFLVIASFIAFSISWFFYRRFLDDSKYPKFCEG